MNRVFRTLIMNAKIDASLTNQNFRIRFHDKCTDSKSFKENFMKWTNFLLDTVGVISENKAAAVQVYSSNGEFEFPHIASSNAKITSENNSNNVDGGSCSNTNSKFHLAVSNSWDKNDIENIASLMEFELGTLWIQFLPKIVNDSEGQIIDSKAFFQSANEILLGNEQNTNYECIGNIADGSEIIWQNPNKNEMEKFLPKLRELCSTHGLQLQLNDQRQ